MTTPYKQALEALDDVTHDGEGHDPMKSSCFMDDHMLVIRRALLIADAVESGKFHLCEKLIGGGEYDGATCYEYYAKLSDEKLNKIGAGE